MAKINKHQIALDQFLEKVKKDKSVIAAIFGGSFFRNEEWEESDIDIVLIVDTEVSDNRTYCYENDILIDIWIYSRSQFIKEVNKGVQRHGFAGTDLLNILLLTSKLIFSKDQMITETINSVGIMRKRNREILQLKYFSMITKFLKKSNKTINLKNNIYHCYYYLSTYIADDLANLVLLLNNDIVSYEIRAIEKASIYEKELFDKIFYNPLNNSCSIDDFKDILDSIENFMSKYRDLIYQPLFDYYKKEARGESFSEISEKFCSSFTNAYIDLDCLVEDDILCKVKDTIYLTKKSKIEFDNYRYYLTKAI